MKSKVMLTLVEMADLIDPEGTSKRLTATKG